MFQAVIVPLDGSELGEAALPYAAALAGKLGAELTLVSVLTEGATAADQESLRAYLAEQAGRLGSGVETSLRLGDPVAQIVAETREHDQAVVVMATETVHGLGGLFHSSVSAQVVHDSQVPVLVVRAAPEGPVGFANILVPLDGSAFAESALPVAKRLARAFEAELQLVRVASTTQFYALAGNDPMSPGATSAMTDIADEVIDEARAFIAAQAERLQREGYRAHGEALVGDPGNQILAFASERHSDLIVMATHGHGGLTRLLFGSVAERVLHDATTPLLLVHPRGELREGNGAPEEGA